MIRFKLLAVASLILFFSACNRKEEPENKGAEIHRTTPEYASRFSFAQYKGFRVIFFHDPWQPEKIAHRVLCLPNDKKRPDSSDAFKIIQTPVKTMVSMSGTQIAAINILNELSTIAGVGDKKLIKQPYLKAEIKKNEIRQVGASKSFNNEVLMSLNPDIVLISPFKGQSHKKLNELGMKILPYADYMEPHPLGRAEWIKVMGALYGKEVQARHYFEEVKRRYKEIKALTKDIDSKPTVFSGKPYGGVWYMPGGESYMAHFFEDAGAHYLWKDSRQAASMALDFETVYAEAARADFWKLVVKAENGYSYNDLLSEDERYGDFKALKNRKIIVCNVATTAYYEKGALEPEVILADFIKAFHPDILLRHQPEYFKILKK